MLTQYADDTTVFLKDEELGQELFKLLNDFSECPCRLKDQNKMRGPTTWSRQERFAPLQ